MAETPEIEIPNPAARPSVRVRRVLDRLDRTAVEAESVRIGGLIARRRSTLGVSQRDLAGQCGTTQSAIARLEAGGTPPRLSTLLRLAEALECDLVVELTPRTT